VSDWMQQSLVPPSAVEVRIRLGFVPERDHAQVMVEAFDPSTRAQLGAWSRHAFPIVDWPQVLEEAVERANQMIAETVEPF
jgi:hypothetical protein